MNDNQRLQAAAWAISLGWGYTPLEDVTVWADEMILDADIPDDSIIALSLTKRVYEAIQILHDASRTVDKWQALAFFLKQFISMQAMEPKFASTLAGHLFREVTYNDDPPPEFVPFYSRWDDIDMAIDGIFGDPKEQVEKFLEDIRIAASIPN